MRVRPRFLDFCWFSEDRWTESEARGGVLSRLILRYQCHRRRWFAVRRSATKYYNLLRRITTETSYDILRITEVYYNSVTHPTSQSHMRIHPPCVGASWNSSMIDSASLITAGSLRMDETNLRREVECYLG